MTSSKSLKGLLITASLLLVSVFGQAQFLRTSYFMEGTHYRQQLNPALTPGRGYINLPVIGSLNASVNSSSLGYQDIIDIIENSDESDYFTSSDFMGRLDGMNDLNVNLSTDIISAGWFKGKNFWSFNIGLRNDIGASIPKSMFEFMREMNGLDLERVDWSNYSKNTGGEKLNVTSYAEVGLGFARNINSRLSVGGRLKALLGIGNMKLDVHTLGIETNFRGIDVAQNINWSEVAANPQMAQALADRIGGTGDVRVNARLESSFKGLTLLENPETGYVDDFDFDAGEMGLSGYGGAIDLGASYKLTKKLTLSAAILDLGFIKWGKASTQIATAQLDNNGQPMFNFDQPTLDSKVAEVQRFADMVSSGEVLNYDMLQMEVQQGETKDRTTRLTSTLVVGAEYALLNDWLVVGALYTGRFAKPETLNELTFSANIRPKNYFNLALSYSVLQGAGKTFGAAMKLGPLFVGTDYMFFGKNTKNVNAYVGLSIPLSKQKKAKGC